MYQSVKIISAVSHTSLDVYVNNKFIEELKVLARSTGKLMFAIDNKPNIKITKFTSKQVVLDWIKNLVVDPLY
jgi:hypothetical protein